MITPRTWIVTLMLATLAAGLAGCSGRADEEVASTPDEAVTAVARGLAEGRPVVLWEMLPASYQKDVSDLIHDAAAKVDAELWNGSFDLLRKVTRLLDEKRDLILEHPLVAAQVKDHRNAEQSWNALVGTFDAVVESEFADLSTLRRLDVGTFLEGTGSRVMERLALASTLSTNDAYTGAMARMRGMQARVLESSGDTATVEIERPGAATTQEAYVRLEGKWIPARLADAWPGQIAEARERIAQFSGEGQQENKRAVLAQLASVDAVLDRLLAARTADEFKAGIGTAVGMALGAAMASSASHGGRVPAFGLFEPGQASFGAPAGPSAVGAPVELVIEGSPPPLEEEGSDVMPAAFGALEADGPNAASADLALLSNFDGTIEPARVDRFVGESLIVVRGNGSELRGRLATVEPDVLIFERDVNGGTVSFEVRRREIQSVRLPR